MLTNNAVIDTRHTNRIDDEMANEMFHEMFVIATLA